MQTGDSREREVVLELRGVTKRFPGVLANNNVDLTLHKGEILALLGENGAGKSTLMNIVYGLYHADSGTIRLKGREVHFASPREAIHSGIGMVHQHFQLIPVMTVAENVVLGEEVTHGVFLDKREAARRVRELSEQYNLAVDPDALVEELPVGMQQRVEIIKALYRDADILILDEPTSVLTPQEVQELFKIMRDLSAKGVSIIFITHTLKEVLAVAHRIVVMRDGEVVGMTTPAESTEESLAAMMVGRSVLLRVEKGPSHPGEVVLRVEGLSAYDDRDHLAVKDVSFEVRTGEVLGIAGVQGNGQTELVEVLTGLRHAISGKVEIEGKDLTGASPRQVTATGSGHIPENRHRYGMVGSYTVAENLVLNTYYGPPYATEPSPRALPVVGGLYAALAAGGFALLALLWGAVWNAGLWPIVLSLYGITDPQSAGRDAMEGPELIGLIALVVMGLVCGMVAHRFAVWGMRKLYPYIEPLYRRLFRDEGGIALDYQAVDRHAAHLVEEFDIRTPSIKNPAQSLSGGNQQKLVVAREFGRHPRLLIAAQPTRGIDVGSIEFIHRQIVAQRDAGAAVLLVSAELDEITALSDRIAVMYKGEIVATVPADAVTREQLGLLMAGAQVEDVLGAPVAEAVA